MAITQAICDSFKEELLEGTHDLDGHTLKMALYTSSATLGSTTTAYSTTNESSGTNYTAGGETISSVTVAKSTSTTYVDFADVSWSSATISDAAGALIYNSSASNKAIAVIDFGATKSVTSGTFGPSINSSIAMGYVKYKFSEIGKKLLLEIRGKKHEARVSELPFYKKKYVR